VDGSVHERGVWLQRHIVFVRISVSCMVERGVREEGVRTAVAPEHFQTQQGFISGFTSELARTHEPALALPTGGLHRPAANQFIRTPSGPTIHPLLTVVELEQFN
jgi:hypothetical protein